MRASSRRVVAIVSLACALLSVLAAGTAGAQSWQREPLRLALERLLSWNFDAQVSIRAIEGPLIPEVVLRDVVIDVEGERFASLGSFRLRVDVWSLLRDDAPVLESLVIEDARFTLVQDASGGWLIPGREKEPESLEGEDQESGARWIEKIQIAELVIRRSHLAIRSEAVDLDLAVDMRLSELTLPWVAEDFGRTKGTLEVAVGPSRLGRERVAEGMLVLQLEGARLAIVRAEATTSFGALRLDGSLDLSRSPTRPAGQLTLDVTGLDWGSSGSGTARFGDLHLELSSIDGERVRIEALELKGGRLPLRVMGVPELRVGRGRVATDGVAIAFAGQTLHIEGALAASQEGGQLSGVRLYTDRLEVAELARRFEWPGEPSGSLRAELVLEGPLAAPTIVGQLSWQSPMIAGVALASVDASLETAGGQLRATLSVREQSGPEGREGSLSGEATLPYTGAQSLWRDPVAIEGARAVLRGEGIRAAIFEPFSSRFARELSGVATFDLEFQGGGKPTVEGKVWLSDAGVFVPLLARRFEPVNASLRLSGDELVLESLQIGDELAGARLSGRLGLARFVPVSLDVDLSMQRFPVSRSRFLTTDVAGQVRISGPLEELVIKGQVSLEKTRVHLREGTDPVLHEIRILASESRQSGATYFVEREDGPGPLDSASIELELAIPHGRFRGRGADVNLSGALKWIKEPSEVSRYTGSVSVVRGVYVFQGRRFRIRRGELSFDGGAALDPVVDIVAVYRVRDVEILAYLSGRLNTLIVRLESDPPMRDSEVLSYLVLGRGSDESRDPQGFGDAASQLAVGVALSEISPIIESVLPIDTLDIRLGRDESDPAEIAVGKYLSGGVFVSVGRTLGRDPVDTLRVEWQLSDHFSLESEVSDDQNAGLDLMWNLDF